METGLLHEDGTPEAGDPHSWPARVENAFVAAVLALMAILPIAEVVLRKAAGTGIPGSIPFVQHFTLWVGLLGGAIAARDGRLLSLATSAFLPKGWVRRAAKEVAATVGAIVATLLFRGAVDLVRNERESGRILAGDIPVWVAQVALPVAFALIAIRLVWRAGPTWRSRLVPALGIALGLWLAQVPEWYVALPAWPAVLMVLAAALLGAPIFVVLGGLAVFLFLKEAIPPVAVLVETYQLSVSPTLASLPLFTLAGFLLAEGHASDRLLRVFRAWFGWLPGGTAVVCALVSAFFTVFTGGSGVTILALGGLLLPALLRDGYRDKFSLGLLTASGSLGLLLPPALPLIVYGIVAQAPIEDLFIGGILPGVVLISLVVGWGIREGLSMKAQHHTFSGREGAAALWDGKWELLLPVVILVSFLGGYATIVETSALAALYAFFTQTVVHREVRVTRDLGRVLTECAVTIGGVLVILGVAVGFTNYLIDANVPARLLEWTQQYVHSKYVFLLLLNVFLLAVGCLMDIYSATFVVVPLIVPLGQAFGIHPVHLGIIFIANLELGYLTPPVGLNLFLSSYRFKRPLMEVTVASLPMLAILGVGVLLITYVPWLTTGLLGLLGR